MYGNVDILLVTRGGKLNICYAVSANGASPAKEFVQGLDLADKAKIAALLQRLANCGTISNAEQFKHVEDSIWELKKHQIRLFCFRDGDSWFLTNGYKKKQDRLNRTEIDRANRIMNEHKAREPKAGKGTDRKRGRP